MVAKLAAAVSWIALIALSLARTPVPDPPLGSHCSCERGRPRRPERYPSLGPYLDD
jgi:hypothetical protein